MSMCVSEVKGCQCQRSSCVLIRACKKFGDMDSVRAVCDSSDISFRCISAVSESPCSSDRLRESMREGEGAKGGEQITKEADMMKERS